MLRRLALRCVMTWTTRRLLWLTHVLLHMSTTVSVLRSRLAWARMNFIRFGNDFGKLDGNTTLSSFLSNKKLNCYSSWKTPNYCFWPHCRYTYMYALTWKNIKVKFLIWYFFHIWHCIRYSSVWIWFFSYQLHSLLHCIVFLVSLAEYTSLLVQLWIPLWGNKKPFYRSISGNVQDTKILNLC